MDNVLISLPCGYDTTYASLQKGEKVIQCMMCEEEDLNIEELLNRPGNRFRIKEKEIEIEMENLKQMTSQISLLKKEPHFFVEKSFERILNELDLRKEVLRNEFEQKLNEYYTETRDDLLKRKEKIIQDLEISLADKNLIENCINLNFTSCSKLKDKLKQIELELEKLLEMNKEIKKIIWKSEYGESLTLSNENDEIQMDYLFGKIRYSLFDFKEKIVLDDGSDNIWCIKQIDENRILSGSFSTINLWDINEEECLKQFSGHDSAIYSLCMLNNDHFASCSEDKTIKIWNIENDECLNTLTGHSDQIWSLKLLSNGHLVSCSDDTTIKFWNYETGECLRTINEHLGSVFCVEELQNNLIISGSFDKTIKIWNIETGENINTLEGHTDSVFCLQRINSNKLASGSGDKTIKIWNLQTGECLITLEGHIDNIYELALLKSGNLVSCSEDGTLRFWDIDSNECLETIEAHNDAITSLLLTQNEEIISGSRDQTLKIWSRI